MPSMTDVQRSDGLMTFAVMVTKLTVKVMMSMVLTILVMMPACFGRR